MALTSEHATGQEPGGPGFSQSYVQALLDDALDAIVLVDDTGRYIEANRAACELLGASRDELLTTGRRMSDLAAPALREAFEEQWRASLAVERQSGECVRVRLDGTTRTVEFGAVAQLAAGMRLAILRNVTRPRARLDRGRRQNDRRRETLSAIDTAILGAASPSLVADAVVQRVATLFSAACARVILFDWVTRNARMVAVWSTHPTQVGRGVELRMSDDVVGPEMLEGRGFIRSDLDQVPHRSWIDDALFSEGIRSLIRVPLRAKAGIIGALQISSTKAHAFDQDQLAVAQDVADHTAVAMTSARMVEEVQSTSMRLVTMSKRLVEVQEVERREVARELHDEIGQQLTGLKLQLDFAIKTGSTSTFVLMESAQLVQDLLSRVRRLSLNLRPPLLDDFGLHRALLAHFGRYTAQTTITVEFSSVGLSNERFAVDVETATFRIVQESLTNVARHSGAGRAEVDVHVEGSCIHASITDRGCGFVVGVPITAGAGVTGMHERIALLGGAFQIASAEGRGTTVTARIPCRTSNGRNP